MPDPRDELNEAPTLRTDGAELRPCKSCGNPLIIAVGPNGSRVPLDAKSVKHTYVIRKDLMGHAVLQHAEEAYVSHFLTCPTANQHSTKGKRR